MPGPEEVARFLDAVSIARNRSVQTAYYGADLRIPETVSLAHADERSAQRWSREPKLTDLLTQQPWSATSWRRLCAALAESASDLLRERAREASEGNAAGCDLALAQHFIALRSKSLGCRQPP